MPLIIHADDFGISETVSRCIAECFKRGWVTETSLMVNMPYSDEAVSLARAEGFSDKVGLHLNLSQGHPLTDDVKQCPRICSPDGTFNKRFHHNLLSRFIMSKRESDAIKKEIQAQVDKFCRYGGLLMKLDSHHHVHTDWAVYRLLESIAVKSGFRSMRISATLHPTGLLMRIYKTMFNKRVSKSFKVTQDFDGFNGNLVSAVKDGRNVELMTHPMYTADGVICDTKTPYKNIMAAFHEDVQG